MNNKEIVRYGIGIIVFFGVIWLLQFYFSTNYDEYGLLNRQYLGDISGCQNCLIIETMDSQYSYFFGLYTVVDRTPKIYYFRDEHTLRSDFLRYTDREYYSSNPLIIKIHWVKVGEGCCIRGVDMIGLLH